MRTQGEGGGSHDQSTGEHVLLSNAEIQTYPDQRADLKAAVGIKATDVDTIYSSLSMLMELANSPPHLEATDRNTSAKKNKKDSSLPASAVEENVSPPSTVESTAASTANVSSSSRPAGGEDDACLFSKNTGGVADIISPNAVSDGNNLAHAFLARIANVPGTIVFRS